jgi:pyrimidine deaminase RibD-like protein
MSNGVRSRTRARTFTDRELMLRAIELSRSCVSEAGKVVPKVGAVVARDGVMLGEAFRGEQAAGQHAEFTLLEQKLFRETLAVGTAVNQGADETPAATNGPCNSRDDGRDPRRLGA